jgi:hypothetical protein
VVTFVRVETHDRLDRPQVVREPALLIAAPPVHNIAKRHPRGRVVVIPDADKVAVLIILQEADFRRISESDRDHVTSRRLPSA